VAPAGGRDSPVISRPADAAQQGPEHVVGELVEPVNRNAEDTLGFPALLALGPCCPGRMLWLPGWPGVGVALDREAEDPVSLFPITGHKSASEIAGHRQSQAWLIRPGLDNAAAEAERLASGPGAAARVSRAEDSTSP
jgi:hypothetical protein